MSRTIFWYIFKDLFRIFMMASGALAGIMSFGGLLRPLTHQGLDIAQVGQVLTYFGPAMTTYSFPIGALFATTVVYGRLAADNELTACRAGGMSLVSLSVAGPALVLGLLVATASLLFLCFVVPACTLKVEKVLYSNLAQLVQTRIEQTHQIQFAQYTIFAQDAWVPPLDPANAGHQQVVLQDPTIVTTERPRPGDPDFRVPKEFWTASQALITINRRAGDEQVFLDVRLTGGFKFPRQFQGGMQAGIEETEAGPILIPSPIKEDTKFMDIWRLKRLFVDPARSQKLRSMVNDLVQNEQAAEFMLGLLAELNSPRGACTFAFDQGQRFVVRREPDAPQASVDRTGEIVIRDARPEQRPVHFQRDEPDRPQLVYDSRELRLKARPSEDGQRMDCSLSLVDCTEETSDGPSPRANFTQHFSAPMTPYMASLADRGLEFYTTQPQGDRLRHETYVLLNQIVAECHDRASFAISCLILVMVGCALGMIFKSGNVLTAFAVSFVPALLSITLTIAGQRSAGNIPPGGNPLDTLHLGLALIWTGNVFNFILASILLWRLHRA